MTTPVSEQKVSDESLRLLNNVVIGTASGMAKMLEHLSSLESQLAEARRDTERLDWLEADAFESIETEGLFTKKSLRAAIDLARSPSTGEDAQ